MIGKIKWFNDVRGYGFIQPSIGGDVFILPPDAHASGLRFDEGMAVVFEPHIMPSGHVAARNIRRHEAK